MSGKRHTLYVTRGHTLDIVLTPEQEEKVRRALALSLEKRDRLGALVIDDGAFEVIIPFGEIVGLATPKTKKVADG